MSNAIENITDNLKIIFLYHILAKIMEACMHVHEMPRVGYTMPKELWLFLLSSNIRLFLRKKSDKKNAQGEIVVLVISK